jgi:hypothetical protein
MRRLEPGIPRGYRRLGQSIFDDLSSDLTTVLSPTPGGGFETTGSTDPNAAYVNASGNDQSTPDPSAGSDNPLAILFNDVAPGATTAVATAANNAANALKGIPSWVWWAGGGAALLAVLSLTTGFRPASWLNKNPRGRRRRARRRRRP